MYSMEQFYNEKIFTKKSKLIINIWIFIILILIIDIILILFNYKYIEYEYYDSVVTNIDNQFYLKLYIDKEKVTDFKTSELLINDDKINYSIYKISDKVYIDEYYNEKYELTIKTTLEEKILIENNLVKIKIRKPKTTIINKIIKIFKKGYINGKT